MGASPTWLHEYVAAKGDATKTARGSSPKIPQEPSQGILKDLKNGTGIFTPGTSLAAALNNLLNPVRQADQVGVDAGSGHPVRAALGAAGLALPAFRLAGLAGRFAGPAADAASDVARVAAPEMADATAGRMIGPNSPVNPVNNLGFTPSASHPIPGFMPQGPASALPGAADAQQMASYHVANAPPAAPMPVAPRPVVAPMQGSGILRDIDPSMYTRTAPEVPGAPRLVLTPHEQAYANLLRRQGVANPETQAAMELRGGAPSGRLR